MDFLKNLFSFKRTRMIDEAVFFHKPISLGKNILYFFAVFVISSLIVAVLQAIPIIIYLSQTPGLLEELTTGTVSAFADALKGMPSWVSGLDLIFSGMFILIAFYYCKKYENRKSFTLGYVKPGWASEYLIGFFVGCALIGIPLLLGFAFGTIQFVGFNFSPVVLLFLVGYIVRGFACSTFVQGYFTVSVARDYLPIVAVSLGSVAFLLFNLSLGGATVVSFINILLLGFFLGIYLFKRGSIFGSSAILAGWSFLQDSVFGTDMSMSPMLGTVSVGSPYLTGSSSGIGGGLFATITLVFAIILLLLTKPRKSQISQFEDDFR